MNLRSTLTVAAVTVGALSGCLGQPSLPALDAEPCLTPPELHDGTLVAGSGAGLPLVRALIAETVPTARVAESIGSSGAARALADGAIDIGVVSRPLRAAEREAGLSTLAIADAPVVWATHPGVTERAVDAAFLRAVYEGEVTTWPDGLPIVPIVRETGDSGLAVLESTYPEVVAALRAARDADRGLLATSDAEALALLEEVPGAVGPSDLGLLRASGSTATALQVGAHRPQALPRRTIALVWRSDRHPDPPVEVRAIATAATPDRLEELGYASP